jgi:hypothetical protein
MATLTTSGWGEARYADGGAFWTVTPTGELDARIWAVESRVQGYGARPWFQIDTQSVTYQGQALEPPTMDEGGRVCFHLTLSPLNGQNRCAQR